MSSRRVVFVRPGDARSTSTYGAAPLTRAQRQQRVASKFAQPKSTRTKTHRVDHKRANRLDRNCSAVNFLWQAEWGDAPSVGTYDVKPGRFGRDVSIGKRPRDTRPLGPAQAQATLGGVNLPPASFTSEEIFNLTAARRGGPAKKVLSKEPPMSMLRARAEARRTTFAQERRFEGTGFTSMGLETRAHGGGAAPITAEAETARHERRIGEIAKARALERQREHARAQLLQHDALARSAEHHRAPAWRTALVREDVNFNLQAAQEQEQEQPTPTPTPTRTTFGRAPSPQQPPTISPRGEAAALVTPKNFLAAGRSLGFAVEGSDSVTTPCTAERTGSRAAVPLQLQAQRQHSDRGGVSAGTAPLANHELAPGWSVHWDPGTSRPFYFKAATAERTWDRVRAADPRLAARERAAARRAAVEVAEVAELGRRKENAGAVARGTGYPRSMRGGDAELQGQRSEAYGDACRANGARMKAKATVAVERGTAKTAPKPRVVRVNSKGRGAGWRPPAGGTIAAAETKAGVASLFGLPQPNQLPAAAADRGEV